VTKKLVYRIGQLIQAATIFQIPLSCTEQYPKGLGPTIPELAELLPKPIEKLTIQCCRMFKLGRCDQHH